MQGSVGNFHHIEAQRLAGIRLTPFKSSLLCSVAATFLVALGGTPALAADGAGGAGGDNTWTSVGGSASATSTGSDGTDGTGTASDYLSGGAGGGSGLTGGNGGAGSGDNPGFSGEGAGGTGEAGYDGSDGGDNSSGGGGGGGAHGYVGLIADLPTSGTVTGGNGGNGGLAGFAGYGGGGGGGGFGAVVTGLNGSDEAITVSAAGGAGGAYGWAGSGGNGGSGLVIYQPAGDNVITLTGSTLSGGAGGGSREGLSFGGDGGSGLVITGGTGSTTVSVSGGSITGGDAAGGASGGDGGNGILVEGMSGTTTLNIATSVTGGAGGTGQIYTSGVGGAGIQGENLAVSIAADGSVSGGLGGNGERAAALNFVGGTNTLTLASGAALTGGIVVATNTTKLEFAQSDDYSLSSAISGAGTLTKTGVGTLTLTGDSSSFTGNLILKGGETVVDGNTLAAGIVFLGSADEPTLLVQNGGALNAANIIVGNSTNSALPGIEDESGVLEVTGSGSTVTADFLTVGYYGDGELTVTDGAEVLVSTVFMAGAIEGSTGTVTVSGENSRLETGTTNFGSSGTGILNLTDGATMQTSSAAFGVNAGSLGTGTVSGEGTRWDIASANLTLGTAGEGVLTVTDGAVVALTSGGNVTLGSFGTGSGSLAVSGTGSRVTTENLFTIGSGSEGSATVSAGGKIAAAQLIVGFSDGGDGVLDISGAGTLAHGSGYVMIGTYAGSTGIVTVSDGATLKSDGGRGITLGYDAGSSGTLNIGAAAGDEAAAAGLIDAAAGIQFGAGEGTLVLNHTDSAYDLSASLSGAGAVDVLAGTTILTGDNSNFAGSIAVDGGKLILDGATAAASTTIGAKGTLQIGNGGSTGSLTGDIVNSGSLVFNRAGTYDFPGTISGSGSVTFLTGMVNFLAANGYSGPISVYGSDFLLSSGAVTTSKLTIGSGGLIGGSGTIGGLTVLGGGTVSPGYSPGKLTVSGNVSFAPESVYVVDITPSGEHDLIVASGKATITGGSVQVVAVEGNYAPGTTYTILAAEKGVTGKFDGVTANYAFLNPTLSYDANDVYLTVARNATPFSDVAATANQRAVAGAVESFGTGNPVYDAVVKLSTDDALQAFDSMTGEAYASATGVLQQQSSYLREAVGARLRQGLDSGKASAGEQTASLTPGSDATVWTQGYGAWGQNTGNGNAARLDRSIGGFFAGVDAGLGDSWRMGAIAGYSRSTFDVDARSSSGDSDNYDLGLYVGGKFGALKLLGGLSYSWHDVSLDRIVAFPGYSGINRADYTAGTTQVFGEAGWTIGLGKTTLEPFAGLAYVKLSSDDFTETGSTSALSGSLATQNTFYSTLGMRAATEFALSKGASIVPHVSLGWQHAFDDVGTSAAMGFTSGGTPFSVGGLPIARDNALVGAGLDYNASNTVSISISYNGQFASGVSDNAFKGTLNIRF